LARADGGAPGSDGRALTPHGRAPGLPALSIPAKVSKMLTERSVGYLSVTDD